jgi:hypothetical protein
MLGFKGDREAAMRTGKLVCVLLGGAVVGTMMAPIPLASAEPRVGRAALPVMGACCLPDYSCLVMYHPDCVEAEGRWHGPNTTCDDTNCEPPPCPSDLDGSGVVDWEDLRILIGCIEQGGCRGGSSGDLNGDGSVDDGDIVAFLDVILTGVC